MGAFEVESLTVALGGTTVLHDVNVSLGTDSVVGLFGQNGAGKTTLIRAACGLINRFEGRIEPRGSGIGYLPDEPFLFENVTLERHLDIYAELHPDFDRSAAIEMLGRLGLRRSLTVRKASKGMSEQIHLAFVLARRCDVYLFDEPLAAVDPLTRDEILTMISTYRNPGSTVVISTHLIAGLESLFDDVMVLHRGRLLLHEGAGAMAAAGGLEQRFKEVVNARQV